MQLVLIRDINLEAAHSAANMSGHTARQIEDLNAESESEPLRGNEIFITSDSLAVLRGDNQLAIDVLVESSNTVESVARCCFAAIERGLHVVLMNAEVDLALGSLLHRAAEEYG
jgi:predicted homoserine dehydrogenase-like protein